MAKEIFNRYENKYLVGEPVYRALQQDLREKMILDKHNKNGEKYTIYNLYYDSDDSHLIRRSLEKPTYKEKVRIRAYDAARDDDTVYVEIKKKYDGLVNKRRTAMKLAEAQRFLDGEKVDVKAYMNAQVVSELTELIGRQKLSEKVLISYDRVAFFDRSDPDLRVSFDHNIQTYRNGDGFERDVGGEKLLSSDQYIMEVKVRWAMPLWLVDILKKYQILPVSFSKYGKEYIKKLEKEECA
jgi:SPX domain protein involved in polyphosphate accumulation